MSSLFVFLAVKRKKKKSPSCGAIVSALSRAISWSLIFLSNLKYLPGPYIFYVFAGQLGGVYMRKLAPARVSYRHDFFISYRVYMMTGLFHI